jgi:hypothetical protein
VKEMRLFSGCAVMGLTLLSISGSVLAAAWTEGGTFPLTLQFDSNPAMSASSPHGVWRLKGSPGIKVTAVQDFDQWTADIKLQVERSSDKAIVLDREDPNATIAWRREFEKGEFGISGHYDEASTRFSEFQDTGLVTKDGSRTTEVVSAYWTRALSERFALLLNGEYRKLKYDAGTLTGNKSQSVTGKLNYSLSNSFSPYMTVSFSRFQPEGGGGDTRSVTGMVGLGWQVSDQLTSDLQLGLNKTSTNGADTIGWQGGATADYVTARSKYRLAYARTTGSAGASSSITSDKVSGSWAYNLNELNTLGADVSWRKNRSAIPVENRNFSAWYGRDIAQDWNFRLSCEYKDTDRGGSSAIARVIGATVTYTTPNF